MQSLQNVWTELWWAMAGGDIVSFEKIKATNIFTFWALFDLWQKGIEQENERLKAQAAASKRR